METGASAISVADLETHRRELVGYCYRMLGSGSEAEDAVQDTMLRGWRSLERFEGRSTLKSWLFRIATNVCLDMLSSAQRRTRPMDLGPARSPHGPLGEILPEATWIEPLSETALTGDDPAALAESRETLRLAFIAALQRLPPRQRAALILCEVLHWRAAEAAELLDTTTAAVNSALQRARAAVEEADRGGLPGATDETVDRDLLERYMDAFERYDMDALAKLIREDAVQSMPPYELWLSGRTDILDFWVGPGAACRGSRMLSAPDANGLPAFGQYKVSETGDGYEPWALQALRFRDGRVDEFTFFLETGRIFPLFGLPERLDREGRPAGAR